MFLFIFWSFVFLSYFIRCVLQLASRIEFNRRFNTSPTAYQRRFQESIHQNAAQMAAEKQPKDSPRRNAASEINTADRASTSSQALTGPSALNIQLPNLQPANTSKRDLARILANRINMDRLQTLRPSSSLGNEKDEEFTVPKRGRLAEKLCQAASLNGRQIEPLTLANPVSEILKVPLSLLWPVRISALRFY